ncbi:hypothetical protein PHMEG_0002738 [Phytophthora megakarya]|uniref:Uncharacterized protein n=1 Tax=Phytophthora megakarya TaxID=4795 RepID=A0A225WXY9_9STRA|nr:hypothetical protein PHMEG_0002738 [Phytophthora megakarya]
MNRMVSRYSSRDQQQEAIQAVGRFSAVAGLRLNVMKSTAVTLGTTKGSTGTKDLVAEMDSVRRQGYHHGVMEESNCGGSFQARDGCSQDKHDPAAGSYSLSHSDSEVTVCGETYMTNR